MALKKSSICIGEGLDIITLLSGRVCFRKPTKLDMPKPRKAVVCAPFVLSCRIEVALLMKSDGVYSGRRRSAVIEFLFCLVRLLFLKKKESGLLNSRRIRK
jgi:hypothetical protein